MKKLIFTLFLLLPASQVSAYFAWGIGQQTCIDFVTAKAEYDHARDRRTHLSQLNWIKGFITGINWSQNSDIAKDLSIETVDEWIDAYCRANTDKTIAEASAELVVHLEKQGQASE